MNDAMQAAMKRIEAREKLAERSSVMDLRRRLARALKALRGSVWYGKPQAHVLGAERAELRMKRK